MGFVVGVLYGRDVGCSKLVVREGFKERGFEG